MNYRTTRIFQRSIELVEFVAQILRCLPSGYGFMADQLRRASSSVALNYLEGCGRSGIADRRRFFQIASGSANEVAAALQVMEAFGVLAVTDRLRGQSICDHLIAMLRRFY